MLCAPGVESDFGKEGIPLGTEFPIVEQDARTLFETHIATVGITDLPPMHVRDDMVERDVILAHEQGGELRGMIDGFGDVVGAVDTHFYADGRFVSGAFVVSVLAGFVCRKALVDRMVIHREMPREKSRAVVPGPEPVFHGHGVVQGVRGPGGIVGGMDGDEGRTHRPVQGASAFSRRDDVLRDFQCDSRDAGEATCDEKRRVKQSTGLHIEITLSDERPEGDENFL